MGTWGPGPFENDKAADFGGDLDDLVEQERPVAIRAALRAAALQAESLDSSKGDVAVAAAAIVAAQCVGGRPTNPSYGPKRKIPPLPADLRTLAVEALDRVVGADSESAELWDESGGEKWRAEVRLLRAVLSADAGASITPG
jgi:hypothetical protein